MECSICGRVGDLIELKLTQEEQALVHAKEVYYCEPCFHAVQDSEAGAQLLKGIYAMKLRALGVSDQMVTKFAQAFYDKLTKRK